MASYTSQYTGTQIDNVIGNALLKAEAQSTYLTQTNANNNFLKITDANATYALKTDLTIPNNNNIYTENEVQVGTWMGSPLYRKCYDGTIYGAYQNYLNIAAWPSNQTLIKTDWTIDIPNVATVSNGDYCYCGIAYGYLFLRQDYTNASLTYSYKIMVYYTKT